MFFIAVEEVWRGGEVGHHYHHSPRKMALADLTHRITPLWASASHSADNTKNIVVVRSD